MPRVCLTNRARAKANTAYALAAKKIQTSNIDAEATVLSAITTNAAPPPSITIDGGCNVSLAHTEAFNSVVIPGTTKAETTKFATAGNAIVSTKHGHLKINFKRNNGTSVLFTETKLCASGACPSGLVLLSEKSLIDGNYTVTKDKHGAWLSTDGVISSDNPRAIPLDSKTAPGLFLVAKGNSTAPASAVAGPRRFGRRNHCLHHRRPKLRHQ